MGQSHADSLTHSHRPHVAIFTLINSHVAAAAAAKSLQSCLTLCDPIDGSPPGSPVPLNNIKSFCKFNCSIVPHGQWLLRWTVKRKDDLSLWEYLQS